MHPLLDWGEKKGNMIVSAFIINGGSVLFINKDPLSRATLAILRSWTDRSSRIFLGPVLKDLRSVGTLFVHTLTETSTTQVTLFCTLQCSGVEFYGQCVLREKLFSSAADSNSRKKSDYMLYNFFISSMKTHENFLIEDLHCKTFGYSKFFRFCDVKNIGAVFLFLFQFLGIFIN